MRAPLVLAALAALLLAGARSVAADPFFLPREREGAWTAPDRQVHFAGSLAIAASLRVEGRSRVESVSGTLLVGVAKEIYDATLKPRRLGRGASRKDLGADLLGALAGVLIVAAADR
jgi:uncharacterized protein YfiM (DUF2279 family)